MRDGHYSSCPFLFPWTVLFPLFFYCHTQSTTPQIRCNFHAPKTRISCTATSLPPVRSCNNFRCSLCSYLFRYWENKLQEFLHNYCLTAYESLFVSLQFLFLALLSRFLVFFCLGLFSFSSFSFSLLLRFSMCSSDVKSMLTCFARLF